MGFGLSGAVIAVFFSTLAYYSFFPDLISFAPKAHLPITLFIAGLMVGFASEGKKRIEQLATRRQWQIGMLKGIESTIPLSLSKIDILQRGLEHLKDMTQAQLGGFFYLTDNIPFILLEDLTKSKISKNKLITWFQSHKKSILYNSLPNPLYTLPSFIKSRNAQCIITPFSSTSGHGWALIISGTSRGRTFWGQNELEIASHISYQIGILLENHSLHEQVSRGKAESETLLDNLRQGVILLDHKNKVLQMNRNARNKLGIQEKIQRPKSLSSFFKSTPFFTEILKKLQSGSEFSLFTGELQGIHGIKTPVEISCIHIPISPSTHEVDARKILHFWDQTEIKQLERESLRIQNLATLGEIAAGVAHEIKNPLGGIQGFSDLLYRDLKEQKPLRQLISKIIHGVQDIQKIVDRMLDLAKPATKIFSKTDLKNALKEAGNLVQLSAKTQGKSFHLQTPPFEMPVFGSFEALKRSFLNLMLNAIEAAPPKKGSIEINIEQKEHEWVIYFIDNGPGVQAEIKERLFQPFVTTKAKGTGLGLSICHTTILEHHGKLNYHREDGKTKFIVKIPIFPESKIEKKERKS